MENWRKWTAETQMTAMLTLWVVASFGDPFAVSFGLWAIIIGGGFIGVVHLNPTVTLCNYVKKKYLKTLTDENRVEFKGNLVFQIVGALIGGLIGTIIATGNHFHFKIGNGSTIAEAIVGEAIFTCQLNLVVMISQEIEFPWIGSLSVAMTVLVGALTVGPISGGCFNPTICLSVNSVKAIYYDDINYMDDLWIYVVGPLIGSAMAVILGCVYLGEKHFKAAISERNSTSSGIPMLSDYKSSDFPE